MKEHPATSFFPMLSDAEYESLRDDINKNGQQEPIVLLDGKVIDGRNRLKACKELGIEPITRETEGEPVELVMSLNYHRRHLRPHEKGESLRQYLKAMGGGKGKAGRPAKNQLAHNGPISINGIAQQLGIPETTAKRQIKAAETYAALPKSIKAKVDSGECPLELAPKVADEVEQKLIKVSKATLDEVNRIEDETNEKHRLVNGVMKWLQSTERGCLFHREFLISHKWSRAEKQIISQSVDEMTKFVREVKGMLK